MGGTQARRLFVAIAGTVSGLVALAWVVGSLGPVASAAWPVGASSLLLFAVPVLTLIAIVATTWYLLAREARDAETDALPYVECGSCGQSILSEWRLCPYCGSRVDPSVATVEAHPE